MVLEIDGSMGEGGGQILRVSVALSTILGKPIRIDNIRRRRSPPGLRPQHKTAVAALAQMSNAAVEGLKIGSTRLTYDPGKLTGGSCFFDTGTAGSVSLILQSLLPVMAFSTRRFYVEVRGGTNNPLAPPVDYLQGVLLPTVSRMGLQASIQLLKRGFYPRGGGIVRAEVEPVKQLTPLVLTECKAIQKIAGVSYSSRLPCHIVERMADSVGKTLAAEGHKDVNLRLECLQPHDRKCARDPGAGILLVAHLLPHGILGSDSLGELGKPAERVGWEAASNLLRQLAAASPVDMFLGDQLIIYMALASGASTIRVSELTSHTVTCMAVSQLIAGVRFNVAGRQGTPATITCGGRR